MLVGRRAEQQAIDRLVAARSPGNRAACSRSPARRASARPRCSITPSRPYRDARPACDRAGVRARDSLRDAAAAASPGSRRRWTASRRSRPMPSQPRSRSRARSAPARRRDRFTIGAAVLEPDLPVRRGWAGRRRRRRPAPRRHSVGERPRVRRAPARGRPRGRAARRAQSGGRQLVAGLPALTVGGLDLDSARLLLTPTPADAADGRSRTAAAPCDRGQPAGAARTGRADRDVIESLETGLPLRVSRALVEAFGRRLARLDAECRAVLLIAAVCGTDFRLIADACAGSGSTSGGSAKPRTWDSSPCAMGASSSGIRCCARRSTRVRRCRSGTLRIAPLPTRRRTPMSTVAPGICPRRSGTPTPTSPPCSPRPASTPSRALPTRWLRARSSGRHG